MSLRIDNFFKKTSRRFIKQGEEKTEPHYYVEYHPEFAEINGKNINAGLLLSYLYKLWPLRSPGNNYIWKDSFELERHTGLSKKEQSRARKILVKNGFLTDRPNYKGHSVEFTINEKVIANALLKLDFEIQYENNEQREEFVNLFGIEAVVLQEERNEAT